MIKIILFKMSIYLYFLINKIMSNFNKKIKKKNQLNLFPNLKILSINNLQEILNYAKIKNKEFF